MPTIADTIRQDHVNMAKLLKILEHEVGLFAKAERPNHDIIQSIVYYFQRYSDRCHHPKEDVVYRHIMAHDANAAGAIGDLEAEHRRIAEQLGMFAEAVRNVLNEAEMPREVFVSAAEKFIAAERRHMGMEEGKFLPLADKLLNAEEWAKIASEVDVETDPLFGKKGAAEFDELREHIINWEAEDNVARARE